jgi:uncharacterized protein (TIGR02246 family)
MLRPSGTWPRCARVVLAAAVGLLTMSTTCTTSGPTNSPEEIASGRAAVNAELQRYAERVMARDHSAIAAMFTPGGVIVSPEGKAIRGPDAIDRYLRHALRDRVVDGRIAPARTTVHGDTARQAGFYEQRMRTWTGGTRRESGRFAVTWLRVRPREWRILRLETRPDR